MFQTEKRNVIPHQKDRVRKSQSHISVTERIDFKLHTQQTRTHAQIERMEKQTETDQLHCPRNYVIRCALIRWSLNERRKKKQQQHAQQLSTAKLDTYMITSSSSRFRFLCNFFVFCFYFWNICFPFAKLFIFSFFFFRYCFPANKLRSLVELFDCFASLKLLHSLTYHANSRPPTKSIQIKPFSNIQMHITFSRHTAIQCNCIA